LSERKLRCCTLRNVLPCEKEKRLRSWEEAIRGKGGTANTFLRVGYKTAGKKSIRVIDEISRISSLLKVGGGPKNVRLAGKAMGRLLLMTACEEYKTAWTSRKCLRKGRPSKKRDANNLASRRQTRRKGGDILLLD